MSEWVRIGARQTGTTTKEEEERRSLHAVGEWEEFMNHGGDESKWQQQ